MTEQQDKKRAWPALRRAALWTAAAVVTAGVAVQETDLLDGTPLEVFNSRASRTQPLKITVAWPALQTAQRIDPATGKPANDDVAAAPAEPVHEVAIVHPAPVETEGALAISPELPHRRAQAEAEAAARQQKALQAREEFERILLAEGKAKPPEFLHDAVGYASTYTGVDPLYLYRLAHAESTFRAGVLNRAGGGAGACGLYQFRRGTYLEMIHRHGDKFPEEYKHMADTVNFTRVGGTRRKPVYGYRLKAEADAETVLAGCYDPRFASLLVSFFTLDLKAAIERRVELGRPLNHADLYIAHFLGINGGPRLLAVYADEDNLGNSITRYAGRLQRAANPGIFRRTRTVEDFYDYFVEQKGMTDTPFDLTPAQFQDVTNIPIEDIPVPVRRPEYPVRGPK